MPQNNSFCVLSRFTYHHLGYKGRLKLEEVFNPTKKMAIKRNFRIAKKRQQAQMQVPMQNPASPN